MGIPSITTNLSGTPLSLPILCLPYLSSLMITYMGHSMSRVRLFHGRAYFRPAELRDLHCGPSSHWTRGVSQTVGRSHVRLLSPQSSTTYYSEEPNRTTLRPPRLEKLGSGTPTIRLSYLTHPTTTHYPLPRTRRVPRHLNSTQFNSHNSTRLHSTPNPESHA